jgi:hypothetical protein
MISCGWIISHRCSWIMVYVLCCNAQVNPIVIFMTYTCIAMHSLFCQLPNCNLFTQHVIYIYGETPLVNYGPRSILLHILSFAASTVYFLQVLFIYYKQTPFSTRYVSSFVYSKPVILTTSLQVGAKYLGCVVCRFHIAAGAGSAPCQKPARNNLEKLFLSPTGRLILVS